MVNQKEPLIYEEIDKVYKIELPIPFPLQTVNVFFVDDSPRTLVDTGIKTETSFEMLRNGLRTLGIGLESIERILITHGHIDHYGQAKKISAISGAKILIHPIEYGKIRSVLHSLGMLRIILLKSGVPQSLVGEAVHDIESAQKLADPLEEASFLADGDEIIFASMRWNVIHCPGHSPGLLCFHWRKKRLLLTGDHLLKKITPNPVLNVPKGNPPFRYTSLIEYLTSLEKIEPLDLFLLLPGHGDDVRDTRGLIHKLRAHHRERMAYILSTLTDGEKTAYQIASSLFSAVRPFEVFLGVSEVLGHLQILREEGKIGIRETGEVDYYFLEKDLSCCSAHCSILPADIEENHEE